MSKIPAWVWFTLLRIATFVVPLVIMLLLGVPGWIAAIAAAIMGLCLSYIFLSKPLSKMSESIEKSRGHKTPASKHDEDYEDAVVDSAVVTKATVARKPRATKSTTSGKATSPKSSRTPAQRTK